MLNNLLKNDIIEQLKNTGRVGHIITENSEETLQITWDGERFALIHIHYPVGPGGFSLPKTTILNPREASEVAAFIQIVLEMIGGIR